MSGLEVDGTGGAVLVFMGQSETQHRIFREVLCRWVSEQEQRSRVKHMDRRERMYVGERTLQCGYPTRVEEHVHEKKDGVHKLACVALANREG
jgi:hypothetical protein